MERARRQSLGVGVLLILLGVLFLVGQLYPSLMGWVGPFSWPLIIVGVGVFLLLLGLVTGAPGMAVPACVVGGIGLLLYWQNATGNWESWAYAWALIPGFVGVGVILTGLLEGRSRGSLLGGAWLVLISLIMFGIFAAFLGGPQILGVYWPVLLILGGLVALIQNFVRAR